MRRTDIGTVGLAGAPVSKADRAYQAILEGIRDQRHEPGDRLVLSQIVAFIKYVQDRTPTLDQGIGAYYQGLGGVLDSGLNPEARDYVAKVRAAMAMF